VFVGFGSISFAQKKYNEAPMLTELVKAGKLPPLQERLPEEPFVVGPGVLIPQEDLKFEIGQYGGTLRMAHPWTKWCGDTYILLREPLLSAPGLETKGIVGNIIKDVKVSKDRKIFTFYMRKGLKWSDGYPVTTEDVQFAYEDVLLNKDLTPVFPTWLRTGNDPAGEPMKLEIIDKYTFRISFAQPYGKFLSMLAITYWPGYATFILPKHYLKQFHIKYTPLEKLQPLLKQEKLGEKEWWNLFNQKNMGDWPRPDEPNAIGFPFLTPWVPVKYEKGVTIYERNPYYFKVDTAGNQLPYIDYIRQELVQDIQMLTMKTVSGEIDFSREKASLADLPLYKQNEEKGGYRIVLLDNHVSPVDVMINLTYNDPVWRKLVKDVRFRRALSLGINRQEIIKNVLYGFASLPTLMPSEFDPKEANRLLDEVGLKKRDSDGWRLRPDGKPLEILFEIAPHWAEIVPTTQLVMEHWKNLGIKTSMKTVDGALLGQDLEANKVMALVINTSPMLWKNFVWPDYRVDWFNYQAPLWKRWYTTGGKEGEEPWPEVKRLQSLHSQFTKALPGTPDDERIAKEILSLMYKSYFYFNTVGDSKLPLIVSQKLGNVPQAGFGIAANYSVEQFFFKK
jgi:peptide/nickel transport system substrate-binding protein